MDPTRARPPSSPARHGMTGVPQAVAGHTLGMRILYGVVGEGMGHATRSRVVLRHLVSRGHRVHVVVSSRAYRFLTEAFADEPSIEVTEIAGLHLAYRENAVDLGATLRRTLAGAPRDLRRNVRVARDVVRTFDPEVAITDFDSFAYLVARSQRLPVVSIDNIQILDRCAHDDEVTEGRCASFKLAKAAVKVRLPGAYHYLVTSFFFPPVRKPRTTLIPPILRDEILAARREPGEHVLVYQTASTNTALVPALKRLPYEFRVYGLGREGEEGNVRLMPFSQSRFIDDLRTARAAVAGGGYSLLGEAVHLRVPTLSVPLEGQYEQSLNAHYLAELGYGARATEVTTQTVGEFLDDVARHQRALDGYTPRDNSTLYEHVDRLLGRIERGEGPVDDPLGAP